jgi:hypothetical protein
MLEREKILIIGKIFNLIMCSNPLWGKFQQHEYKVIFEMVENILYKVKSEHVSLGVGKASKKLKVNSENK